MAVQGFTGSHAVEGITWFNAESNEGLGYLTLGALLKSKEWSVGALTLTS